MFPTQARVGIPPVRPGREVPTPPLGLEAKSLKNGMTFYWTKPDLLARSRARTNKQTMLVLFLSKIYIFLDS